MSVIRKTAAVFLALVMLLGVTACGKAKVINDSWAPSDGKQVEELELWLTHSLDRVRKNRTSNGKNTITIAGAKGEYESFQIVASTESEKPIKLTGLTVSDFTDKKGNVIEAERYVTLYREHYIVTNVGESSDTVICETSGEIPDALIPVKNPKTGEPMPSTSRFYAFPFELTNAACQPFFVDVEIPRDAVAGEYTAVYEMQTDKGTQGGVVTLKVWNITLSKINSQGSFFGAWSGLSEDKTVEAVKNRMFINASNSEIEEELYKEYGYNNANVGFWSGSDMDDKSMKNPAPTVDKVKDKVKKHYSKLDMFAYTADEISGEAFYSGIIKYAQALHQGGVKQLIVMTPEPELLDDGLGKGQPAVDIFVVLPKQYDDNTEKIKLAREKGCEIWTYNCLLHDSYSPKWLLHYPLIDYRIQPGFINYAIDADGFLFWVVDNWTTVGDPWHSLDMSYTGDGILFYPSEEVGLYETYIPSLRVKAIRDGFEDFELCTAIEKAGGKVDEYTKTIATGFSDWTQDGQVLWDARIKLGDANSK